MPDRTLSIADRYRRLARRSWPRSYPIAQFPNPPLLLAIAGWIVSAVSSGDLHSVGRAAFYVGLAVWAWLELSAGVNTFRRVSGAAVLIWTVAEFAKYIPG